MKGTLALVRHLCGHYEAVGSDRRAEVVSRTDCPRCRTNSPEDAEFRAEQKLAMEESRRLMAPTASLVTNELMEFIAASGGRPWPKAKFTEFVRAEATRLTLGSIAYVQVWGREESMPSLEFLSDAYRATEMEPEDFLHAYPLTMGRVNLWRKGVAHLLGRKLPSPSPISAERVVEMVARHGRKVLDAPPYGRRSPITSALTTEMSVALGRVGLRRRFKELAVPLIMESAPGRADLIGVGGERQDVVIEIDAEHNPGSISKLVFARQAGALPVWVRWRTWEEPGAVPKGIHLVNLAPEPAPGEPEPEAVHPDGEQSSGKEPS